jgi:hypothetical protein
MSNLAGRRGAVNVQPPGTVRGVHDDLDSDDQLVEDELEADEEELTEEAANGHLLSIRRADGTELVSFSTLASGEPWAVYMQPGGGVQNAYAGPQDSPHVWVNADEHQISRDEDGTYVIVVE